MSFDKVRNKNKHISFNSSTVVGKKSLIQSVIFIIDPTQTWLGLILAVLI